MPDERALAQLRGIGEVHHMLEREGISHWLFGGWAVDFQAGRVTRVHDDVDFAVWLSDAERIAVLLEQTGWTHAPDPDEDGGTGFERGRVRIELTFLVLLPDGTAAVRLRQSDMPFAGDVLAGELRELDGERCYVLGTDVLATMKSGRRDDPGQQEKDAADLAALSGDS